MTLRFTVLGIPIPKGSAKGFIVKTKTGPRAVVTHDNPKTRPWQESIVSAARDAMGEVTPMTGPLGLVVRFFLPRPQSAPRRVVDHVTRPDLDKLLRAIKDGLTRAGAYHDDGQVVMVLTHKAFAGGFADPMLDRGIPRAVVELGWGPGLQVEWRWNEVAAAPPPARETSNATV